MPWANGLGTTAVIARFPDVDDVWAWRLSIADVVTDGPFSVLAGVDRFIAVADGVGMTLVVDDLPPVTLSSTSTSTSASTSASTTVYAFDGGASTHCSLLDGPVADLNLMVRRGVAVGELEVIDLTASTSVVAAGSVALVVLAGCITVDGYRLERFDALVADLSGEVGDADGLIELVIEAVEPARVAVVRVRPA